MLRHLRQHGPQTAAQLRQTCGGLDAALLELRAAWLIFTTQGDGTRAGRHAQVLAAPQGSAHHLCELLALHANVRGERGTLAHFARKWQLSPGDTLSALMALRALGLASGAVTGATLAASVHHGPPEFLESVTPTPGTLRACPA